MGAGSPPAKSPYTPRKLQAGTIVPVGDSITSNGGVYDLRVPNKVYFTAKGLVNWLTIFSNGKLRQIPGGYPIPLGASSGCIYKINVVSGGSGYTGATAIAISGSGGTGATATPIIQNGAIVGVTVTARGSGYQQKPVIAVTDTGGGSGAVLFGVVGGTSTFGVGGAGSTDIATLVPDVLAVSPTMALLLTATNDQTVGLTLQQTKDAIQQMCGQLLGANVTPIVVAPLARNQAQGLSINYRNIYIGRWIMRDLPTLCPGVIPVDPNPWLVDPNTGDTQANWLADGLHPSQLGAFNIATQIWAQISWMFGTGINRADSTLDIYDASFNPAGNLAPQPMLTNGTPVALTTPWSGFRMSTISLVATGATAAGTIAGSVENPRSDGLPGARQVMTVSVTGGADGDIYRLQLGFPTIAVGGANNLQPGDQVEIEIEVAMSGQSNIKGVEFYAQHSSSASSVAALLTTYINNGTVAATSYPQSDWSGTMRLPVVTVPASTLGLFCFLDVTVGAGAAAFVMKAARFGVKKVGV